MDGTDIFSDLGVPGAAGDAAPMSDAGALGFEDGLAEGGFAEVTGFADSDGFSEDHPAGERAERDEDGTIEFTLSDHAGGPTIFDGSGGIDTLRLVLEETEFRTLQDELIELRDWMEGVPGDATGEPGAASPAFDGAGTGSDASGTAGDVFATSFGVVVKDVLNLEVHVKGIGPVSVEDRLPDIDAMEEAFARAEASHAAEVLSALGGILGDDTLVGGDGDDKLKGGKGDDDLDDGDSDDDLRGDKGDDVLNGGTGDDKLRGDKGDDTLNGGADSDVLDGGKGDDMLIYTVGENGYATDRYDGGKGSDTLRLEMTADEFYALQGELIELSDWIDDTANAKRSQGHAFKDSSWHSAKHTIYETSFGLKVRNVETLEVKVEGYGLVGDLEAGMPDLAPDPVVIDLETVPVADPSTIDSTVAGDDSMSLAEVNATLQPGSVATVSVDIEVGDKPQKYDVFLLQDVSGSFGDDLANVQAQFSTLFDTLTAGGDARFGLGSFVDKPLLPFGFGGTGDFVYETNVGITGDKAAVQAALDGLEAHWGVDAPDAQLEALLQVAVREAEVGFRADAEKFVVMTTDSPFHIEGDYPDFGPNDLDAVIGSEDYPTVEDVGNLLKSAGITPVFAVTADVADLYQNLVDAWGIGGVTILDADSTNYATTIDDGLTATNTDLTLSVSGDDFGYGRSRRRSTNRPRRAPIPST
jgi:Ca2+-binding RTX toxin-like protein